MPARWTGIETVGRAKDDGPFVRQILAVVVPTPLKAEALPLAARRAVHLRSPKVGQNFRELHTILAPDRDH